MEVIPGKVSEVYFNWLYDQIYTVRDLHSPFSYVMVCRFMHSTTFQDLVPHDDNRVAEAAELRNEFLRKTRHAPLELSDILTPDASVLEVLIALARRADYMVPLGTFVWFEMFVKNLGLDGWHDQECGLRNTLAAQNVIIRFNERRYKPDGKGGIFPLKRPKEDQRHVELWYQMGAYMTANGMY